MAAKFKGSSKQILALRSFIKLVRAANSVSADCSRVYLAKNLTESQFGVLEALYHLGPMSQKQLSEKLLKSGGNLTMVIDNLAKHDLVMRQKRLDDRRFYWVSLTDRGRELISAIFPDHVELITQRLSVLNEDEQLQLESLCRKLGLGFGQF